MAHTMAESCNTKHVLVAQYMRKSKKELIEEAVSRNLSGISSKSKYELIILLSTSNAPKKIHIEHSPTPAPLILYTTPLEMPPCDGSMESPTTVIDRPWVHHRSYSSKGDGKWMLFYPSNEIDSKWQHLCKAFDNNELEGITSMKCSTSMKTGRSSNDSEGVIILYCANSSDEDSILQKGRAILPFIQDYSTDTHIRYKTNVQSRTGTQATGCVTNSTYKLRVNMNAPLFRS